MSKKEAMVEVGCQTDIIPEQNIVRESSTEPDTQITSISASVYEGNTVIKLTEQEEIDPYKNLTNQVGKEFSSIEQASTMQKYLEPYTQMKIEVKLK